MGPLKIAQFCWESLHAVREGGLSPAATHLAEVLGTEHEVHFFTRGEGPDRIIRNVAYHFCQPEGDTIIDYCQDLSRKLLQKFHDADTPPFDIIHFHDWHCSDALERLQDRRTVMSYHSTEYGRNGGNFGDWPEFQAISAREWRCGHLARHVVTVSRHTETEIMWLYGIPERRITVIPNGIYPEHYYLPLDPGSVKKRYGIHPLAPLVLFIGRLVYQKGPDLLVDAIPQVLQRRWDVQFIIAGKGDMKRDLEERCRALPVQFTGYIPDEEYLQLLNACDLVVIPSRNEPFGLVLTEAWSAEKCAVATDVGGLAENIEDFVDGIKVPVRADSLAWGISYIIEDPVRIRAMGVAGKRKVLSRFNWARIGRMMDKVYTRVISGTDDGSRGSGR
ncbi:MAG TPA: glycosyltransferase family 4 protein [Methanoregulaceae archaeon]|nr:glycosyltransferase family 4 protein [Methanoregulaceae archaeon]HPD10921.1 glycosyltransferase family 4 protein [Methanoregulaceae archaeon]HRT16066.1 glycosyltransferase family 4 protein [Methanoregulaceae archaeon]HRU31572.1 glycosyltransferase family 4 protein [Methanoregulaceae archaeon]